MALTDYALILMGTLVVECLTMVTVRADDYVKVEDPCRLGYTPFSSVKKNGAPECNGYMEVIADSRCSVGSKERGSRRETTWEDGMTTCIVESVKSVECP